MSNINTLLHSVPKLNGLNYHDWKFAIQMVLWRAGSWEIISGALPKPETGSEDWEKKADEGLTFIGLSVDTTQYAYIRHASNGVEAWQALKDIYEKNSRATRITLKRQFYSYQHDEMHPIAEYISGITNLAAQLKSLNVTLTDTDIVDVLIFNLHESWGNIASSLTAITGELKINDVTGALMDEEGRKGGPPVSDSDSPAFAMYSKLRDRSVKRVCFRCQRPGHIERDCHAKSDINGKEISRIAFEINDSLNDIAY
jgi:hypothetical protein